MHTLVSSQLLTTTHARRALARAYNLPPASWFADTCGARCGISARCRQEVDGAFVAIGHKPSTQLFEVHRPTFSGEATTNASLPVCPLLSASASCLPVCKPLALKHEPEHPCPLFVASLLACVLACVCGWVGGRRRAERDGARSSGAAKPYRTRLAAETHTGGCHRHHNDKTGCQMPAVDITQTSYGQQWLTAWYCCWAGHCRRTGRGRLHHN